MVKKNLFVVAFLLCLVALTTTIFTSDEKDQTKALNKKYDDRDCKASKITTIELKKAIADKKVAIVDVNGTKAYAKAHILGSHDFNAQGFDARLPADKSSLVVVYFSGEQCSEDKDACKKCSGSTDLREKCSSSKEACDKCEDNKEVRDKCNASKASLESTNATKDAAEKIKALGYSNIKCYCAGLNGWIAAGGTTEKE